MSSSHLIEDPVGVFFFHTGHKKETHFCVVPKILLTKEPQETTAKENYERESKKSIYAVRFGKLENLSNEEFQNRIKVGRYEILSLEAVESVNETNDVELHVARFDSSDNNYKFEKTTDHAHTPPYFVKEHLAIFLVNRVCRTNNLVFNAQFTFLDYLACHDFETRFIEKDDKLLVEIPLEKVDALTLYNSNFVPRVPIRRQATSASKSTISIYHYTKYNFLAAFTPPHEIASSVHPLFLLENFSPNNYKNYQFVPILRGFAYDDEIDGFRKVHADLAKLTAIDTGKSSIIRQQYITVLSNQKLAVQSLAFNPALKKTLGDICKDFVGLHLITEDVSKKIIDEELSDVLSSSKISRNLFVICQFVLDKYVNVHATNGALMYKDLHEFHDANVNGLETQSLTPFVVTDTEIQQFFFPLFDKKLEPGRGAFPAGPSIVSDSDARNVTPSGVFPLSRANDASRSTRPPSETEMVREFEDDWRAEDAESDTIADEFRRTFDTNDRGEEDDHVGDDGAQDFAQPPLRSRPPEGLGPRDGPEPPSAAEDDLSAPPGDLPVGIDPSTTDVRGSSGKDSAIRRASARDIGDQLSMLLFYGVPFFVPLFFVFSSVIEQDFKGVMYLLGLMASLVLSYASFLGAEYAWSLVDSLRGWFRGRSLAPKDTVSVLASNATILTGGKPDAESSSPVAAVAAAAPNTCIRVIVGSTDYAREMNIALVVLAYTFMYLLSCAVFGNLYEDGFADFPRYASMFTLFLALALHNFVVSSSLPSCRAQRSEDDGSFGKYTTDALSVLFGALFGYVSAACVHAMGVPELLYYGPRGGGYNSKDGAQRCRRSDGTTVWCK